MEITGTLLLIYTPDRIPIERDTLEARAALAISGSVNSPNYLQHS